MKRCYCNISELTKLLGYIREWNLISRTFIPAQIVLSILLRCYPFDVLIKIKDIEEALDVKVIVVDYTGEDLIQKINEYKEEEI